ncbi:MAG: carbamoyltransferase HypF [Nitrosospira sp.]|nr:carbamoyltransferase HypF [Nitrosospira sp.]
MHPDEAKDQQVIQGRGPEARRWLVTGRVQGVGFRPFVFRLAQRFSLTGRVQNLTGQVLIEAEGETSMLDAFGAALLTDAPPLAQPELICAEKISYRGLDCFEIKPSAAAPLLQIHIPPDYFLCDDCRREMQNPDNRRYRYPFINCTQCGPRYTLITHMPYDRPNTTMAGFELCAACRTEYENPLDRRFHAEPVACPACGPRLCFTTPTDNIVGDEALVACASALRQGEIVAVKGIGGYHLMCDAGNATAIARLRANKHRPHKPLALMFPWRGVDGLEHVQRELEVDARIQALLRDPARAIVLLRQRGDSMLPESIAPELNEIGAMLPYSPLHHLLLDELGKPVVITSGNVSGEPVLTENGEVEERLGNVTKVFLHHNRPIARPADDPVMRIIAGKPRLMRAGRGIAPVEFDFPDAFERSLLAVGGHMKNTVALGWDRRAVLAPHIGDLDAPRSLAVFEQVIADLQRLYGVIPQVIVCDAHSGYASSRWAARQGLPLVRVWHHHAHASAVAMEHGPKRTWLMFTWDGAGLGEDGTLWGGEALHGRPGAWRRVARMRPFRLPGGERAGREPWRSGMSLCWESGIDEQPCTVDSALLKKAWKKGLNAPITTAVGRLFDGAASLLGLIDKASYEGQAGMYLESAAAGDAEAIDLPLEKDTSGLLTADWKPLIQALLRGDVPVAQRAMQFHMSLARSIVAQAQCIQASTPFDLVGLTGGVFQNKLLAELAVAQLAAAGFDAYLPERIPCNDGGLAFGQLAEAEFAHG